MARKKSGKHSKTPAATSATARRSSIALGAATAVVGASLALGVTPAFAQTGTTGAPAQPAGSAAQPTANNNQKPADNKKAAGKQADKKQVETKNNKKQDVQAEKTERGEVSSKKPAAGNNAAAKPVDNKDSNSATTDDKTTNVASSTPAETTVKSRKKRAAVEEIQQAEAPAPENQDRADNKHNPNEVAFSKKLPNIYGWATPSNTFDEKLEKQQVVYHLPKSADGKKVARVVILPDSKDSINTDDPDAYKKIIEFDSKNIDTMHQSYSGIYELHTNDDGSVDLIMKQPFRDGGISSGQGYCANRSIFLYYDESNLQHDQTSNNFRVATLVPPKTAGSIVLKYGERLSADKVREVLHKAVNLPTEHKAGSSVAEQLVAQSKSTGVGLRVDENTVNNTPDTVDAKIPQSMGSYDEAMFGEINKKNDSGDYSFGERKLKTHLVTDLGMKSPEIPLTVVRYSTRIDKPVVDTVDFSKLTDDQKTQIKKNLAKLNGVSTDKVKFDSNGNATIDFDGLSPQDDPKIPLSDLVLTRVATDKIAIPSDSENSKVKAVVVANPLGYSNAELQQIKKAIYEANKDNQELGLSEKDYEKQISLGWITGDTTASGGQNTGISNGMNENKITVTIKTDKAYTQFKSDIQKHELTRLIDLRKDYTLSWDADKNKIKDRNTDEGLAWMEDGKTLVYRYDPDKGEQINTQAVLDLLKATVKSDVKADNPQLRDNLLGSEITNATREGLKGETRRTHRSYTVDKNGEPIGVLNLVKLNGGGYGGFAKPVDNSNKKMGDEQSSVNKYTFDDESKAVEVAGKNGKCMIGRLFIEPYSLYYYNYVYGENKYNLRNTPKGINVVFVPQTKNKKDDLSKSIGKHTLAADKKTPTDSKYYNASDAKKAAYDDALKVAQQTLEKVGNKTDADLSEELKAEVDNATIKLDKARAELDGPDTNKDKLNASIEANGKAAEGSTAATPGTVTTDRYKNVTDQAFQTDDGKPDTKKNEAAKAAKTAYDEALAEANKVKDDDNATQKAVDAAKAKLDAARAKLNDFTTSKDKLNAAIAEHGKAKYVEDAQGAQTLAPAYQNATEKERRAYDDAVAQANELAQDPNASQKDVNAAIDALQKAKAALDAKATDKSQLITAEKLTFDNPDKDDASKQSTFYKNALNKKDNGASEQEKQAAKTAVENYDNALQKAREVLKNDKATQKEVDDAKDALTKAEKVLHDTYATDPNELTKVLADNFSGYLMPAYFNAFDKAQAGDADAKKAFKDYNYAYQKAKELKQKLEESKTGGDAPDQNQIDEAKKALEEARKVIDKYATNTSRLSAAVFNDLAIQNSPAYKNVSADDASADAKAAKDKYDKAVEKLNQALNKQMPKDKQGNTEIPTSNTPDANIDVNNANALDNIQAHAQGEPLDRDITKILKEMNDAIADLNKSATKTDELLKSVNEHDNTQKTPAFKNANQPDFKQADGTTADETKNNAAKAAAAAYGDALNAAKDLLKNPAATQKEVNEALKTLNEKRTALDAYNTDTTKLKASVKKHGDTDGAAPTEGTQTSDAYRNTSDPHFMKEEGGKLVPDKDKNDKAAAAKKAYDEALTKAQELLKKHDDKATPQDAKPTQKEINAALHALDTARTNLDTYKTDTSKLEEEANKSTAEHAAVTEPDFESTPEFQNADAKKKDGADGKKVDNDDVKAYKDALAKARKLAQDNTSNTLSDHPTQKQIDDALEALKKAKQAITDGYKTDVEKLKQAKQYAEDVFKKTPEYKNATAIKDDANNAKHDQAGKDLGDATKQTGFEGQIAKIAEKLKDTSKLTQREVDALVKQLNIAQKKIADDYKTNVTPLSNEVGDKDKDGKDVTPPFEESIPYKNALYKKQSETGDAATGNDSATKKLQDYNDKFKAAKKIIDQVKNPDPNADPDKKPTNADVKSALEALQKAKKAINDAFTTNAKDLKDESAKSTADGVTTVGKDDFEATTEFKNADSKKTDDGKDNADITAYKDALTNARTLLGKFDENGKPKSGEKDVPTQQEIDEALKKLKEIKDKITADYKTSSTELQQEVDKSKDGNKDTRDDVFENTPAFKNATAKGDDAAKQALKDYNDKLVAAKKLLEKFDRTTGKPKEGATDVPTQKDLYDALDALQDAKAKIAKDYATNKDDLTKEYGNSPNVSNYGWASDAAKDEYKKALEAAKKKLDDENATQAEVDDAQKKLQEALAALVRSENANRSAWYEGMVIDARNALQKLVDANEATHLKDLYTHAEAAAQQEFMAAMANAKKVLADKYAFVSELDAARVRLLQALDGLAAHQLPGMTNAGANGNAGAGANGAAGYGAHAAGAYGRGAHAAGRVRAHAGKHLAQTSDPTNALAAAGMLASALGFIAMGFKTKKRRAK